MSKINVIGLDLAKNVFQVHGINEDGDVAVPNNSNALTYCVILPGC